MKKFVSILAVIAILGTLGGVAVSPSQATIVGGPCDVALDEFGGENETWNAACEAYAIAIALCIADGDCPHYE